jgi:serine/threonine protein kinase
MARRLVGSYELLHPVWRDCLGATFIARDRCGRPVALRVLPAALAADAAVRRHFEEDGPLLRSLRHPNLAGVVDLVTAGETLAVVSEAVVGTSLRQPGELPRDHIRRGVAAGLSALREAGLPHRLLAPGTVILARTGEVRLTDIALSRLLADSAAGRALLKPSSDPAFRALLRRPLRPPRLPFVALRARWEHVFDLSPGSSTPVDNCAENGACGRVL